MSSPVATSASISSGHCFPPRATTDGSNNVFVNGLPAHRVGDTWPVHTCPAIPASHDSVTVTGSSTVFANGRPLARVGDSLDCGETIVTGSNNVYAG